MDLIGKTALITGGGRGIGRACALALAKAGAQIVVVARSQSEIEKVAKEVEELGRPAMAVVMDVKDLASIEAAFVKCAERFGSCDILVNNAGIATSAPLIKSTEEMWQEVMDVNLTGVFRCMKAALPYMLKRGWGRIINISSVAGKAGAPYISAYTASKHGVIGLTRAVAQEVAEKRITVNAICPGYVETDMAEHAVTTIISKTGLTRDAAIDMLKQMTPQKRLFQADEVAFLTVSLASHLSAGINGQAINICGGALPN